MSRLGFGSFFLLIGILLFLGGCAGGGVGMGAGPGAMGEFGPEDAMMMGDPFLGGFGGFGFPIY